jgi:hypothetical protein
MRSNLTKVSLLVFCACGSETVVAPPPDPVDTFEVTVTFTASSRSCGCTFSFTAKASDPNRSVDYWFSTGFIQTGTFFGEWSPQSWTYGGCARSGTVEYRFSSGSYTLNGSKTASC